MRAPNIRQASECAIAAGALKRQPTSDWSFIVGEAMEFMPGNDEHPLCHDNAMGLGVEEFYEMRCRDHPKHAKAFA